MHRLVEIKGKDIPYDAEPTWSTHNAHVDLRMRYFNIGTGMEPNLT